MRPYALLEVLGLCAVASMAQALTLNPPPDFDAVRKRAAFIGIIEVAGVPGEPSKGFFGDQSNRVKDPVRLQPGNVLVLPAVPDRE